MRNFPMALAAVVALLGAPLANAELQLAAAGLELGRAGQAGEAQVRPNSADIRRIQQRLNEAGYNAGQVNGEFGDATRKALVNFQRKMGLAPTGRLDELTALALGFSAPEYAEMAGARRLGPEDIRAVQEALNKAGYNAGAVDGLWGQRTRSALREFQAAKGLPVDGELDDRTLLALGISLAEFAAGEFAPKEE